jgi:hypothetical protein
VEGGYKRDCEGGYEVVGKEVIKEVRKAVRKEFRERGNIEG